MRVTILAFLLTALALPGSAHAQYRGVRFEITQVGESTFVFAAGKEKWIKKGSAGIAVDPKRRDALVARFRVTDVAAGEVSALVEGQTTNVRTDHVVILAEPRRSWVKQPTFWWGLVTGSALGASIALAR
ncbi:MAG: hypothetical protein ABI877_11885 [Gemmatimonadaceae bacterium]